LLVALVALAVLQRAVLHKQVVRVVQQEQFPSRI
jgi:hypothetical protein